MAGEIYQCLISSNLLVFKNDFPSGLTMISKGRLRFTAY